MIEQTLERIAAALETLTAQNAQLLGSVEKPANPAPLTVAEDPAPAVTETKTAKGGKGTSKTTAMPKAAEAPAPATEPEPEPEPEAPVAEEGPVVTAEEVRATFLKASALDKPEADKIFTAFKAENKTSKLSENTPEQLADLKARLDAFIQAAEM